MATDSSEASAAA